MSQIPPELLEICREAESRPLEKFAYPLREMPTVAVHAAMELYAHSVSFCQQGGFPVSSIRIEIKSAVCTAKNNRRKAVIGTTLVFDGSKWGAACNITQVGPDLEMEGESSLILLDKPGKPISSRVAPGGDSFLVRTGHWRAEKPIYERLKQWRQLIEPWKPKTSMTWTAAAVNILKEKDEKAVIQMLSDGDRRHLMISERVQVYETALKNPAYKTFSSETRGMIESTLHALRSMGNSKQYQTMEQLFGARPSFGNADPVFGLLPFF